MTFVFLRPIDAYMIAVNLTYYFPHVMALGFLAGVFTTRIPHKWHFFVRVIGTLLVALFLAHFNRVFYVWPKYLYFASGHMTFSLGMALSLGLLRPWTLWMTLPLMIPFGYFLVRLHFHNTADIVGAVLIVAVVYGLSDRFWGLKQRAVPLDSRTVSS